MSQATTENARPANLHEPSIYVVDDEAMLLELAEVILKPIGYQVHTFRDPQQALDAFTAALPKPDLLITDYAMHTMNGMDLITACRRLAPSQRIILLSGTVGPEIFYHAECKPDSFLGKPYTARQLTDLVKSLLP
jgi:CheY-like chemotaxis protein